MNTLQKNIEEILEVDNKEVTYHLKAARRNHKRFYDFKDYETLKKTYTHLNENGWTLQISIL